MNSGNIALEGYGLHPNEVPNVVTSGYGVGIEINILVPIPPNTIIIGDLPIDGIISMEPANIISMEIPAPMVGAETAIVSTRVRSSNLIGIIGGSITGSESAGITGKISDGIIGLLPRDILSPRIATPVESEEPDDIISEEP